MRNLCILFITIALLSACSQLGIQFDHSKTKQSSGVSKPFKNTQSGPISHYYDFEDILIPKEMKLNAKKSIVFETPTLKAGAMVFTGKVEPVSLFNFFMNNMPQDNWKLRSYFKYGRYIMVFEKEEKVCIIRIKEDSFNTELTIWITPRITTSKQTIQEEMLNQ